MKVFRYVCTFAMICVLILVLAGCGGGGSDQEPEYPERRLYNYCNQSPQPCNS